MRLPAVAAVLVAAVQATAPSGCTPASQACDLSFQGLYIHAGEVWDVVTVACDPKPTQHYIQAWMEYKRFDEYDSYGRHTATKDIPDKIGFQLEVHSTCVEGWFRAKARVEGRGPATPQHPEGLPFDFENTGRTKYITAGECAGGG
jgi:hypothetical protein